jgi:hypothetical protein
MVALVTPGMIGGATLAPNITGGLQQGQQLAANQLQLDQARQQAAAQQQQAAMQAKQQAQAQDLIRRQQGGEQIQTGAELAQLMVDNPDLANRVLKGAGISSEFQKNDAAEFGFLLENTPVEQRQQLIEERIQRVQARGGDARDSIALLQASPDRQNQTARLLQLAALTPAERRKVADQAKKFELQEQELALRGELGRGQLGLQREQFEFKKQQVANDLARRQQQDPAIKASKFIPGQGFAVLNEAGEVTLKRLPEGVNPGDEPPPKLSAALEKKLIATGDEAQRASTEAASLQSLAQRFEDEQPKGGFFGGTVAEKFKELTGSEDEITLIRKRFNDIRVSQAIQNLPVGPASDTDVALVLSGFLPSTADSKTISKWLRGLAKLEQENARFNDFKSAFISGGGSPDRSKRNFTIDGVQINKGSRIKDVYKTFRNAQPILRSSILNRSISENDIQKEMDESGLSREQVLEELGIN